MNPDRTPYTEILTGSLVADALKSAKACGAGGRAGEGLVVLRADSAFYTHDVIATARRA